MSTRKILLSLIALMSALSACGGSDAANAVTEFSVSAQEFEFSPSSWTVAANSDVNITFTNDGSVDHEWAVLTEGTNISSGDEFNEEIVLWEVEAIPAGDTVTETFNFAPGTYQVICALEGHLDAGMTGTLTVEG